MSQRVRDGLGLPAGLYRFNGDDAPTVFVPNGITADDVDSIVYANVIPVSGGNYDLIVWDANTDALVPQGNPHPSPTDFNNEVNALLDDVLHELFRAGQPEGEYPYMTVPSDSRANIVNDLTTLKADFVLDMQ